MVDFPGSIDMMLPTHYSFDSITPRKIVIHKTAGNTNLQSLYNTFFQTMRSTHYGIDLDGTIAQFVPENRGAGGNCCVDPAPNHNSLWDALVQEFGNLNLCTLSVEHVDPTADNSFVMPQAQIDASHRLVKWWCDQHGLTWLDVHSHASINGVNKSRCPGPTYNFQALFDYLNAPKGGPPVTNQNMVIQAKDTWDSSVFPTAGPNGFITFAPLPYDTGIAASWTHGYLTNPRPMGAPTSKEFPSIRKDGKSIIVQFFGKDRCEWDGTAHWMLTGL
jgi:hypothetical protein